MTHFASYHETVSQRLPQCCKYLSETIGRYQWYVRTGQPDVKRVHLLAERTLVDHEGFVRVCCKFVAFDESALAAGLVCAPEDLHAYVDVHYAGALTAHQAYLFKLLLHDRWYKGDFERIRRMLRLADPLPLINFACNVLWERGYENHYTLGQQLSIRITTKLIQSGLDFKHHQDDDPKAAAAFNRGWSDAAFEKFICSFAAVSDVIKRHRNNNKYIALELLPQHSDRLKECLERDFTLVTNRFIENICVLVLDEDKNSMQYLVKLSPLIHNRTVNVIFVTDLDYYMKSNEYPFYLYNSLKFYYYCLKNKFVFEKADYEILFLLNMIVSLEWCNKGHLNSFTLEKSAIYNPLELSTRRLNSLKRAATQSRVVANDSEIKIDFIQGKRIKTGTHYGHRIVQLEPK